MAPIGIQKKKTTSNRAGFSTAVLRVSKLNDETPPPSTMDEIRNMYIQNRREINTLYTQLEKANTLPPALRNMLGHEYMRANLAIVRCSEMKRVARKAEKSHKASDADIVCEK
ncbi:hypothetical protein EXVG_00471 [Emiliania huxleyi virus 202]|nr:hypothetical protein EXVG_00471 [Emiliania huxleyi virus 202]AHA54380.1 hypothetical protein EhV18_00334 [Emiliania huxleyi virus 18]AHA55420.1 hypothetical protein EhV156_00325 [Emiliania huxleyi virus 156]